MVIIIDPALKDGVIENFVVNIHELIRLIDLNKFQVLISKQVLFNREFLDFAFCHFLVQLDIRSIRSILFVDSDNTRINDLIYLT